jgi:cytochrome c
MSAIRPLPLFTLATLLSGCALAADAVPADAAKVDAPTVDAAKAESAKGNADTGKDIFMTNACATCHGVTKGDDMKVGPNLLNLIGRKAGTGKSLLGASENLKKYGVTWATDTLNEFLENPNAKVPGTPMSGILTDPQQRADVIAYLYTLKEE